MHFLQFTATVFPLLAPLPVSRTAAALAFYSFSRTFAQAWGITIGATILQNRLARTLPAAFLSRFPAGAEIAYAAIPQIAALDEPLRDEVREAFAQSLKVVWETMLGICGVGLLSVGLMREVQMVTHTDETYGLHDERAAGESKRPDCDVEKLERPERLSGIDENQNVTKGKGGERQEVLVARES